MKNTANLEHITTKAIFNRLPFLATPMVKSTRYIVSLNP